MKRKLLFIVAAVVALLLGGTTLCAYAESQEETELTQNITDLLNELDLSELDTYLEEHSYEILSQFGNNSREILEYILNGNMNVDYGSYFNELINVIFNDALSLIPAFSQIIAIILLSSVLSAVNGNGLSETTKRIVKFACYGVILLLLASVLTGIVTECKNCITLLKRQVEIISPILITLTVLTGGSGSAAIYQPSAIFLSEVAVEIISGFVFPLTIGVAILNFLSKLNPELSFGGVTKLLKSILKWVMGLIVAVFGIFLTVQSASSSLLDGILFKATKYVVGSSVPIVGNFLSSGVDTFVSAGLLIKNSVGVCGLIMLLSEVIQPIISLLAFSLVLKLVGAIAQPLGENTLYALFSDLSSDIEYFLAGLLTIAFMYALIIMLVVNSAVSFI